MNAFNRLVMIVLSLLLIAVPVLLLLVGLGVLPAEQVNQYTGYNAALSAINGLSSASLDNSTARAIIVGVGVLVGLVAALLLFRELAFGRRVSRRALVDDTQDREVAVTAQAVRHLVEGAAREVGANSPTCYLASRKRRYDVSCNILVPRAEDLAEVADRARENIRRVLDEQRVPTQDVEVTVQGTTTEPASRA